MIALQILFIIGILWSLFSAFWLALEFKYTIMCIPGFILGTLTYAASLSFIYFIYKVFMCFFFGVPL